LGLSVLGLSVLRLLWRVVLTRLRDWLWLLWDLLRLLLELLCARYGGVAGVAWRCGGGCAGHAVVVEGDAEDDEVYEEDHAAKVRTRTSDKCRAGCRTYKLKAPKTAPATRAPQYAP
jgi:hypothetical protein